MADAKSESRDETSGDEPGSETPQDPGALPGIDFSTFLLSLSTSALYHMGVVLHPDSGEAAEPNPMLARQTIDTLEMLHEKTRGNLDDEEKKLFDGLLYELRMRFVELTNG